MKAKENCIFVIFGASGDLAKRKLIPALFDLKKQNFLPDRFVVLGTGRTELTDENFREKMIEAIKEFAKPGKDEEIAKFAKNLYYVSIHTSSQESYQKLANRLDELNSKFLIQNYIYYLAIPPKLYSTVAHNLGIYHLAQEEKGFKRLIVEKPFGYDLQSSKELNQKLLEIFQENQIYRIDHYLGKETVQNVFVTRFSNGIFEPLWNRNYIQHIEITSAESIGVGKRGGYYDHTGALRDMLQNHLLQLVGLIAMEPPSSFDSNAIRNETLKVFQSLHPLKEEYIRKNVIRGQYIGYLQEQGVEKNSKTETYAALKFYIDNWRWGGIPFYVRTGKRLPFRVTEIVINFKSTPHHLFKNRERNCEACNQLVIRIQPDEGILLKFGMKVPGSGFKVQNTSMNFHYSSLSDVYIPTAYERLILDALIGDSTLYARGDAVEACWTFVDPILKLWEKEEDIVYEYKPGTWGPECADQLIEGNLTWRYPCKNLDDETYCAL